MKIEKIDYVSIILKDILEAEKFFSDLFHMKFAPFGQLDEMGAKSVLEPCGIELVTPVVPDGPAAKTLGNRGKGICMNIKTYPKSGTYSRSIVWSFQIYSDCVISIVCPLIFMVLSRLDYSQLLPSLSCL